MDVAGRMDAVLTAARVAPLTRGIGLKPTVIATHTEPFHISKAIATLDYSLLTVSSWSQSTGQSSACRSGQAMIEPSRSGTETSPGPRGRG